jgi:eukaryotic translation initiation factor 2C
MQVSITIPLGGGDDKSISNKNDRRLIMSKVSELYGQQELGGKRFAYDGESTLYTVGPLPFQSQEFTILLDDSAFNK